MLSEFQVNLVWENMLAAETRSLYFADLAKRYTRRKQWITGLSFFLSSGAAASVVAKAPTWIAAVLALIVAAITAYAIAVNLDDAAGTMVRLHLSWAQIAIDYEHLWNYTHDESAEAELEEIERREIPLSELATTKAPNDQRLLAKWQDQVFRLHRLVDQHG